MDFENKRKKFTKEELKNQLLEYKELLNEYYYGYLDSLIDLEKPITTNNNHILANLDIYKNIARYNIINISLNLFNNQKENYNIENNNDNLYISKFIDQNNIKLFEFNYSENSKIGINIPEYYKTMNIGTISLYLTIESKEVREKEILRIINILESLYNEKNIYPSKPGLFGGPAAYWLHEHQNKVKKYEEKFKKLDNKKELTDDEKKEIEITNQIYEKLMHTYNLSTEEFDEENNNKLLFDYDDKKTELRKTLVIKKPNLNIKTNIKYI